MKTLLHRVSIRKYQNRPVEREHIIEILRAGMQAPSATNQQPWEFYVVEDRAMIKALSESSPYAGCVAGAPVVIVAAYLTDCRVPVYAHIDMSIAMENIWLATDNEGIIRISGNVSNPKSLRFKQYSPAQQNFDIEDATACLEDSRGRL